MTNPENSSVPSSQTSPDQQRPESATQRLTALSALLENIDEVAHADTSTSKSLEVAYENKLVQVRLGVASALFTSLRSKHAATAAHSLRVALGCSSWTLSMDISEETRDEIEVAALLHDVGKVGVPDKILRKPGKLTADEAAIVERHRKGGLEILTACSASREILDTVYHANAWYDGTRGGYDRSGDQLPLGSRMIAIVDAFDAMTTDHVYRRALSRERAVTELFECAGTQFSPALVKEFCDLLSTDRVRFNQHVAHRWLQELHAEASDAMWCLSKLAPGSRESSIDSLFQQKLVDSMHDAVVFVDNSLRIMLWNRAAERLTGIPANAVLQHQWEPELVKMQDEHGEDLSGSDCPIDYAIKSGVQTMRRLSIEGRNKQRIAIDAHMVPVIGRDGVSHGATLMLHDASSQITLEERVETLHVKATQDPLTGVSNRSEFDRVHDQFVTTHLEQKLPCSLIICDLDFFKRINDNFGHQAGDDALISFATVLKQHCRKGDLVARYGGEEFVMLCADCDNTAATNRAEELRRELAEFPQPALGGKAITASFGVTEIQPGDTPETMLRRSDRALLKAKDLGRNTVVQLGSGIREQESSQKPTGWLSWFRSATPDQLLGRSLITAVPLNIVAEKLRGFVSDHHAEITAIEQDHIVLKIEGHQPDILRRRNDRPVPFIFEMRFEESHVEQHGRSSGTALRTLIHVSIRPIRNRDRRRRNVVDRARQLLVSLKSYLMAQDYANLDSIKEKPGEGDQAPGKPLTPLSVKD